MSPSRISNQSLQIFTCFLRIFWHAQIVVVYLTNDLKFPMEPLDRTGAQDGSVFLFLLSTLGLTAKQD